MSEATVTNAQRIKFQAELWPDACEAMGWPVRDRAFRLDKLSEWLGREILSFNEVGKLREFDIVKGQCLAVSQPANLNAQVRQENQPLIRLRHACRTLAPQAYREAIMSRRFHTTDLDALDEGQLTQLRNTLAARSNRLRRGPAVQAESKQAEKAVAEEEHPF